MQTYARIEDGVVVETFQTEADITTLFHPSIVWIACPTSVTPGWTYASDIFAAPPPPVAVAEPPYMPSPREWLERLAPATQQAISQAAIANPSILLWLLKATGSSQIDVTLPETINGVGALVSAGVLTAADQTTLLTP